VVVIPAKDDCSDPAGTDYEDGPDIFERRQEENVEGDPQTQTNKQTNKQTRG